MNGPPGTGKTTMLLRQSQAFGCVLPFAARNRRWSGAASSNNQAVTNIIDAFGKDFGKGEGPFAGRWLPGGGEPGCSLRRIPDASKQPRRYQTEEFQAERETVAYVQRAKDASVQAARAGFPISLTLIWHLWWQPCRSG